MKDLKEKLRSLEEQRVRLNSELESIKKNTGKQLVQDDAFADFDEKTITRLKNEIMALEELENAIDNASELLELRDKAGQEISELQKAESRLKKQLAPMYEELGKIAYDQFRQGGDYKPVYQEVFARLVKDENLIVDLDSKLDQPGKEGALGAVANFGKRLWWGTRKVVAGQSAKGHFRKAAEELEEKGLLTDLIPGGVSPEYVAIQTELTENRVAKLKTEQERAALEVKLSEMDISGQGMVKDLRAQYSAQQKTLEEGFRSLGADYLSTAKQSENKDVAKQIKEYKTFSKQLNQCEQDILCHENALLWVKRNQQLEHVQKDIEHRENEISRLNSELKEMQEDRASRIDDLNDLAAKSGSVLKDAGLQLSSEQTE